MYKKIETNRLYLRNICDTDFDTLFALDQDPEVMKYIGDGSINTDEKATRAGLQKIRMYGNMYPGFGVWVGVEKETEQVIGWFALKHLDRSGLIEIGYRLHKKFWNKGYATEMVKVLVEYGFQLGLSKIVAVTHPQNKASKRVLEKAGFYFEKQAFFYGMEVDQFSIESVKP